MKLSSGKRIGQSGGEFAAAALFSFFLHAIILAAALLYVQGAPMKHVPLFYDVKLVGPEVGKAEVPEASSSQQPPAKEQKQATPKGKKTAPKGKKASLKTPKAKSRKITMPELAKTVKKPAPASAEVKEAPGATPAPPGKETPGAGAGSVAQGEGVAVSTPQQDFKFAYYLNQVRDKISQNWRPPPDAPDAKARVVFSINRSGWVGEINLDAEHSTGTFGFKQAAIRAIRASNPFPRLPDEFSKQTLEFSVDLMTEQ